MEVKSGVRRATPGFLGHIFRLPLQKKGRRKKRRPNTPVPEESKKKFYINTGPAHNKPIARAMRMRGWTKTDDFDLAQVVYSYGTHADWFTELAPWQRFNHSPNYKKWNQKDSFARIMNDYKLKSGKELPSLPETYCLENPEERKLFQKRLKSGGGMDHPWVLKKPTINQGKGIEMLGPNSPELKGAVARVEQELEANGDEAHKYIIQSYICNEMTFNNRKFDFRVFWLVASLDPVILLYHDGYVRLGNSDYNEGDFSNTVQHLTTHTGLAEEGKGDWDDFEQRLLDHRQQYITELGHISDPLDHVKKQVKQALAEMGEAFKDESFQRFELTAENGFGFYGADFVLDNDMDVWFIEPQAGCGMDEDFQFRIDMHNSLFTGMIDVVEEIQESQERNDPIMELKNMGNWEVVYADGWQFEYPGYQRAKDKKGCELKKPSGEKAHKRRLRRV